jgi:hypothetical protein
MDNHRLAGGQFSPKKAAVLVSWNHADHLGIGAHSGREITLQGTKFNRDLKQIREPGGLTHIL